MADLLLAGAYLSIAIMACPVANNGEALAVLWGDHDSLGDESERRIRYALNLWHRGERTRLIFCIGGSRPSKAFSGNRILCERLASNGVPPDVLRMGSGSNDTISNLLEILNVARRNHVQRVVAIVDPLQGFRMQMFLAGGTDPLISVASYSYTSAYPAVGPIFMWRRVHQEWLALLSLLLPEAVRLDWINLLRH